MYEKKEEWNEELIFLYEVVENVINESYEIHISKFVSFPDSILNRASEVFEELKI
ncbi:MAG: MutS-related protein [Wolbachia sp.]